MNNNNSTVTDARSPRVVKAEYMAAFEPVEPGSTKHEELIDYYRTNEPTDPVLVGMTAAMEKETSPGRLGEMYGHVFAVAPEFPDTIGPAWANNHDRPGVNQENNPTLLWYRELVNEKFFTASIVRDDAFDVDADRVSVGQTTLTVNIDQNDMIEFLTAEHAREAGQKLLAVADAFDQLVAAEK